MSTTLHDFKGVQDMICPAKQKIDLESLKSQIYSKMDNINREYQKSKYGGDFPKDANKRNNKSTEGSLREGSKKGLITIKKSVK